ncbi:hypothetical protein ACFRCI_46220 [Streptomyces sp. NPDC056638]|uniref:hypothetical protein n=1 Tax=Streptomyces sp. NPDC056638 TaxID=3345887 RepID=UPI0036CFA2C1
MSKHLSRTTSGRTIASTHWAVTAFRNAFRFLLCAVAAMTVTLSGGSPATAAGPQEFQIEYQHDGGIFTNNRYDVYIFGTVTRHGDQYKLKAVVRSTCLHDSGPSQEWSLAFGSSAESWRYVSGSCPNYEHKVSVTRTGPLGSDGRVYVQAGAYGGRGFGSWGWGDAKSVWV